MKLTNINKQEEFGYDWFSDLRDKFDENLKELQEKWRNLEREIDNRDENIAQLQIELGGNNDQKQKIRDEYETKLLIQKEEFLEKENELKSDLSMHSKEIVEGYKSEIKDLVSKLKDSETSNNKLLDEKLKIQGIMDQQSEQVEFFSDKINKLQDELNLRKEIEEGVTQNLRAAEEEIRTLKLSQKERIIKSFEVKFINIEKNAEKTEKLISGTVQTCQSLEDKTYFVRITYKSPKEKRTKSIKVEADSLGGIIPVSESRAAIQWKNKSGVLKKQEVELDDIEILEELLMEIGNITYR